jgi:hypothetical protein
MMHISLNTTANTSQSRLTLVEAFGRGSDRPVKSELRTEPLDQLLTEYGDRCFIVVYDCTTTRLGVWNG